MKENDIKRHQSYFIEPEVKLNTFNADDLKLRKGWHRFFFFLIWWFVVGAL